MNQDFIPVNIPLISPADREAVILALDEGLVSGDTKLVSQFENNWANFNSRKYGIAVANGSVAIDLVINALEIGPGDEVIMPAFTIISCLAEVLRRGATHIFVDAQSDTWNMEIGLVAEKITSRTKLILVVHIYGLPTDLDPLIELAEKFGIPILEDSAEAHGLLYKGRVCGSHGFASTFSFYANKNITSGEGGMILTDDATLAEKLRTLRNLAFKPERRFHHDILGWNYRLGSLQAALGNSQIERLQEIVARRIEIAELYYAGLGDLDGIQLPLRETPYSKNNFWVFGLVLRDHPKFRSNVQVMKALDSEGVGSRPFFWPLHRQEVLRKFGHYDENLHLPVAENLGSYGFYVPNGLAITNREIEIVIDKLRRVLG